MNSTKIAKRFSKLTVLAACIVIVTACGRYERSPIQNAYVEQSDKILGQFAREVAQTRYGAVSSSSGVRGTTNFQNVCIPGFTVNCGTGGGGQFPGAGGGQVPPGFGGGTGGGGFGSPYLQDQSAELNKLLQAFQMMTMQAGSSPGVGLQALAMLAQGLDRLLVQSSQQLYAFAFQQMGPNSQQYFQFLLDSRGVNNNPGNFGYNTFNDPMSMMFLLGMNGNNWR